MHRVIMNAPPHLQVDHINHDTLDNRKHNLRLVTPPQNRLNSCKQERSLSQFKGVTWNKRKKKWVTQISFNRKRRFAGYFDNEIDAALAYNQKAQELFGEYALLNQILKKDGQR